MSEHLSSPERPESVTPRIYVASLADYNAGRLHGVWIDAAESVDEVHDQIQQMLKASREPLAEEYAIHDNEGFGPHMVDEFDSVGQVVRIAQGIEAHGEAFAHWASVVGHESIDELEQFEDAFLGEWFSLEQYAEQLLEDSGIDVEELGPDWLQPYIRVDLEQFAHDLALDLTVSEGRSRVFIFQC